MSSSWLFYAWLSGAAALSVGCAGRFDPANFEGTREPQRAKADAISDVAARSSEMEALGTVRASCRLEPGFRRLDEERLSDLDCSTDRLLSALHESAASAGGEVLVGAHCNSRRLGITSRATYQVSCAAQVARYVREAELGPNDSPRSRPHGSPAPSAAEVKRIDEPDASLAFRISVSFEPAVAKFERRPLRGEDVHELSVLPIAHRALGDLAASCEESCDERALRYGVLIAAGRLGAPDVVAVRCFSSGSGNSCVGTLAAPERDE